MASNLFFKIECCLSGSGIAGKNSRILKRRKEMKGLKAVGVLFITLAVLWSAPVCQPSFSRNEKTGIRITAICDGSKLSHTKNNVYVLKPDEYHRYIDDKLDIKNMPVSGETPLFLSSLPKGEYYVGVEIILNQKVINPYGLMLSDVWPDRYYVDDMYNGFQRGAEPSFGKGGRLTGIKLYFVKWYRVAVTNKIENVVALFLKKSENLVEWDKFYPPEKRYHIVQDSIALKNIWEAARNIGIVTSPEEKDKIIDLLERGGKVYFPRNNKPNAFFVDADGRMNFNTRLDIDEALAKGKLFVATDVLPAITSNSSASKAKARPPTLPPDMEKKFPPFKHKLIGPNEIRVYNPNDFTAYVAVRKDNYGSNFIVYPQSSASTFVPNGKHDIYFIYSSNPKALFQGDSLTLNDKGIEIELVKVAGGNYGIRRVK